VLGEEESEESESESNSESTAIRRGSSRTASELEEERGVRDSWERQEVKAVMSES